MKLEMYSNHNDDYKGTEWGGLGICKGKEDDGAHFVGHMCMLDSSLQILYFGVCCLYYVV